MWVLQPYFEFLTWWHPSVGGYVVPCDDPLGLLSSNIVKEKRGTSTFKRYQTSPKVEELSPRIEEQHRRRMSKRLSAMEFGHEIGPSFHGFTHLTCGYGFSYPQQ